MYNTYHYDFFSVFLKPPYQEENDLESKFLVAKSILDSLW